MERWFLQGRLAAKCALDVSIRAMLVAFGALLVACTSARAAEEHVAHVFDASLSLTGSCSTSTEDPIPDPGLCPMPPGVPGIDHPPSAFNVPCAVVTDSYGDIYVTSESPKKLAEGRVDIFGPDGEYITTIVDAHHPCDLAVDSQGNLYVYENTTLEEGNRVLLFAPPSYPPQAGASYPTEAEAVVVHKNPPSGSNGRARAIAVDPSNDHLYIAFGSLDEGISEYGAAAENLPAEEWTPIKEKLGTGIENGGINGGFDVYGENHDIYSAGTNSSTPGNEPPAQRIYVFDGATGEKKCESNGAETPDGGFSFSQGNAGIAIDQATGDLFVDDTKVNKVIDRFDADCEYIDQLPKPPKLQQPGFRAGLAVDGPCLGPGNTSCTLGGYHSPDAGYVYVGSGESPSNSHLYAFKPRKGGPPEIDSQVATDITDTEARLEARVNPHDLETSYTFEYISEADYEADGNEFGAGAISAPAPPADVGDSASFVPVSEPIMGLQPGTVYRFRLIAENEAGITKGEGEPGGVGSDASFTTYLAEVKGELPDGRGYELVTPPNTGGYVPTMSEFGYSPLASGSAFTTDFAGPGGNSLAFGIEGGSLPGLPGGGFHDTYEAHRESDGGFGRWQSEFSGVTGSEALQSFPGGVSPDHTSSFWALKEGTLAQEGNYIRRTGGVLDPECSPEPAGHLELIGCGTLGTEPMASGGLISDDSSHVIFSTQSVSKAQQLEPQAAPTGTGSVYDRTADGVTHVASLKPGDVPFAKDENATYLGASADGTAVAFEVKGTVYVRLDGKETVEVTDGDPSFGGLSAHGERVFYLRRNAAQPLLEGTQIPQGEIFVCDVRLGPCAGSGSQEPIEIGAGAESVLVNVSADGSHAFFVSPETLDAEGNGKEGENNLYVWNGVSIQLIAALDSIDVVGGESNGGEGFSVDGLGLWATNVVNPLPGAFSGFSNDPSRTTPDGTVFVFESRTDLTGSTNGGHSEVFRYDASSGGQLNCLSCNPTGAAATADAELESDPPPAFHLLPPVTALARVSNVTPNGDRVFFQSAEPLVLGDIDNGIDVYEWEADGEGGCGREQGCVHLISSGHSAGDDYLYAMTSDGHDVFFESGDLLVPRDHAPTPSIYDARVGGGEAPEEAPPGDCAGESCPLATPVPEEVTPASSRFNGPGNPTSTRPHCRKGQHRVRRAGRSRCVRKHHRRKRKSGPSKHRRTAR